jgi:hypothetical protein
LNKSWYSLYQWVRWVRFGVNNAPNYANKTAFATIKSDGSIMAWGNPYFGGKKAPTNSGYIEIYSNERAFAALKADGSITTWGGALGASLPP